MNFLFLNIEFFGVLSRPKIILSSLADCRFAAYAKNNIKLYKENTFNDRFNNCKYLQLKP